MSKRFVLNSFATVLSFLVNILINLFLTPYLVKNVGSEAYGYIGLANNFVNYITIISTGLNSMAVRYITIKLFRGTTDELNKYFNSILFSNLFLCAIVMAVTCVMILNLQYIINIPGELVIDTKILFALVFVNFMMTLCDTVFTVALFSENRVDIKNLFKIAGDLLRIVFLFVVFKLAPSHVWYIGLSLVMANLIVFIADLHYTRVIFTKVKISIKYFDFKVIKEVLKSGIWNSVSSISRILNTECDLLLTNLFVSPYYMGALSIAKVIPSFIKQFISRFLEVFDPIYTVSYAKESHETFLKNIIDSMKIICIISSIVISGIIIFGEEFYKIWMPTEDSNLLQLLSVITILDMAFCITLEPLYMVFVILNKLKVNTFVLLGNSILSFITTFIILKTTDLGIFAVVSIPVFYGILRAMTFMPIYSARILNIKWYYFYPQILKNLLSEIILINIGWSIKSIIAIHSWTTLFICAILLSVIGIILNIFIFLNRSDRQKYFCQIKERLERKL